MTVQLGALAARRRLGASVAVAVSLWLLSGLVAVGSAQASTVTGFTVSASTYSAGATAVEYMVQFTATSAIPASTGYVELTGPAGATFSGSTTNYHVQANGTSPLRTEAENVVVSPGSRGDNIVDIYVPNAISAGATVVLDAYESHNPTSAVPSGEFSMSTSSDTTATVPVGFAITAPTAVGSLSVTSTSPEAGSQEVQDTATFTAATPIVYADNDTFPTQCLDGECNQGGIFLTAPAGTVFASYIYDYVVKDLTSDEVDEQPSISAAVDPEGLGYNVVEVLPEIAIHAGDQVQVIAYEVENPSSQESGSFSVSTTSDVTSTSTAFSYEAPDAPTDVVDAVTGTTSGAGETGYLIGLTSTHAIPFYNAGSDGTGYVVLTFPVGTIAGSLGGGTAYMSDATHTTPLQAGPLGEYGYNPSANQVDIPVPFSVPAGDALTITITGATNPTPFTLPSVSTTSDPVATSDSVPSAVAATAGNVSAQLSWRAPPAPTGASVDYVVTPYIGTTAQQPIDTLSSLNSFVVAGLANGTTYTFVVQAKLSYGGTTYQPGPPSAASNAVTPSGSVSGPPIATPSATTLGFGTEFLGRTTASQTVVFFDTGGETLAISSVSVTGADSSSFAIGSDTCSGQSIASAQSCAVTVSFTPQASGALTASLAFSDNATGSPQQVSLDGVGTDTATVSGVVTAKAPDEPPVAAATVYICGTDSIGKPSCGSATTDAAGRYSISGLPLGAATVSVVGGSYIATIFTTTLQLGVQTINASLSAPQPPPAGVTVTGGSINDGFPSFYDGSAASVQFAPSFPSEPAGTELVYFTTATVTEVDNNPPILGFSGAVALLVSYDSHGKPSVLGQYPDTQSGPTPTVTFSATPTSSQSDMLETGIRGPILLQYLPNGQLQASFTPAEIAAGAKAFTTCTRYAVIGHPKAALGVQAKSGEFDVGAVSPTPALTDCGSSSSVNFNLYFDPSGTVESTTHVPLESAIVKLLRSSEAAGEFTQVPNGSTIMSATNRRDPDHTTALGQFGWETVAGYYRITAHHHGCTASGHHATAESRVYQVPPPVDDVVLTLKCPHLWRAPSHVRLRMQRMRGTMTAVTATVSGRHAVGYVTFSGHGVPAVKLPISSKSRQATFILTKRRERIVARYLGDANNRPSAAAGRSR
jgi:hypothetical protein